ncbi:MAG: PEP-CTERM sorting domain-containing protein [Phycisphaerae bacterium]|nr:PEP-CTERM sorting domain-containing protein [Phycisphaerae bacterium]
MLCGLAGTVSATVVQTNILLGEYELAGCLSDDLVNDGTTTLAQESYAPGWIEEGSPSMLNDGKVCEPDDYWNGDVCSWNADWMTQYTLNTTTNTLGYDIQTIDIIGGQLNGGINRIECTIDYKRVGDTEFSTLGYFSYNPGTGGGTKLSLSDDQGMILSGVSELKFSFGVGYVIREIDVVGTATPEPATLSLLVIGGLLVLRRKR